MTSNQSLQDRAAWHEAGHIVLALRHKIHIESLKSSNGWPTLYVRPEPNRKEYALFLLGGMAAECHVFGDFDPRGGDSDRKQFLQLLSNSDFQPFLQEAKNVLVEEIETLQALKCAIITAIFEAAFETNDEFALLQKEEIEKIWTTVKQQHTRAQ